MNCPGCNAQLLDDARFCGSCGATTQKQSNFVPEAQSYSQPAGGSFHFDRDGRGQGRGYAWAIEHQGAFALAIVKLQPEQSIAAEAGAMVSMTANVDLYSEMKGGVF